MTIKLTGLVAATHTPFHADGSLNLAAVEKQAEHLLRTGVSTVFIGGTTGESSSLSVDERLALAQRWAEIARQTPMRVVVHVGANSIADAKALAAQAQSLGASAIAALCPSYFKPASIDALVAGSVEIASAAPALPFYYYDIPSMTGVTHSSPAFLEAAASKIPTLAGIKFTNSDLAAYQRCLHAEGGRFDMPFGLDEFLLAALALGATGAVGSSYNFAAPIYLRIIAAFAHNDLATARQEQLRSVQLIELLSRYGYMAAAKATMGFLGVDVGAPRLPNMSLSPGRQVELRGGLERLGFFDWVGS
ncbi:MAG TPA: dihydrodipicolinate synthase family protein [Pirellulaceae bacterium]|jgi:N-acetylneuraminate lyase|nr:dihydrodipicolinate synthase family protein [Pirellulaceae bacterium]